MANPVGAKVTIYKDEDKIICDPVHIQPGDTMDIKGHGLIVWFADDEAGEANAIRVLIKSQQEKVKRALDFQMNKIRKLIG